MRVLLGVLAALFVAALGGLIMGEYALAGPLALVAGVLFGIAVAEAAITAGASRSWALALPAAVAAGVGLTWAAWIDAGHEIGLIAGARWAGSVVAALSAGWWVRSLGARSAPRDEAQEAPAQI